MVASLHAYRSLGYILFMMARCCSRKRFTSGTKQKRNLTYKISLDQCGKMTVSIGHLGLAEHYSVQAAQPKLDYVAVVIWRLFDLFDDQYQFRGAPEDFELRVALIAAAEGQFLWRFRRGGGPARNMGRVQ